MGKTCRTHYTGTFNDGMVFDSSYVRGEPLEFICGAGMMIRGFDAAVANMGVGQTLQVHLMPSKAYGEADPEAILAVEISDVPGADLMEPFKSFDAEISVMLGEDPDHMEEYTITAPSVIRIPPNFWHCPVNFKRVGKPVNFMPMYPDGTFSRISRQFIKGDGTATYVYDAVGLGRCRYDPEKTCNYCGKCFSEAGE